MLTLRSDSQLVLRALADQSDAFEALVFRYQKKAHAIARALGVSDAHVDDVVQDAFLKTFENLPRLRSPERFGIWFLNIVRNGARRWLRDHRTGVDLSLIDPDGPEAPSPERDELEEEIARSVSELPETLREAIFLYYYEGESVKEVARTLRISKGAVLKRLERGRALLRERLWQAMEDTIREMLPGAREWEKKGRYTSLLILGAGVSVLGAGGAATATAAAPVEVGAVVGHPLRNAMLGGVLMSGKKAGVAFGIIALALLAGGYLINLPDRDETSGRAAATVAGEDTGVAGAVTTVIEPEESSAGDAGDTPVAPVPRSESIVGTVVDERGSPIEGARLFALNSRVWSANWLEAPRELRSAANADVTAPLERLLEDYRRQAAELPESTTAGDGTYRFYDLEGGDYRVVVGHADYLPSRDNWAGVRNRETFRRDIVLFSAQSIAGRVVDDAGRAVAGASVHARPSRERRVRGHEKRDQLLVNWREGSFLVDPETMQSRRDGTFRVGSLEPAHYDLVAWKEGCARARVFDVPAGDQLVRLVLPRGASLSGQVVTENGDPIAAAEVRLEETPAARPRPNQGREARHVMVTGVGHEGRVKRSVAADAEGWFRLGGLDRTRYRLTVNAPRYPPLVTEVHLEEPVVDLGALVLRAPEPITGIVLGPDGDPVQGARVRIKELLLEGIERWSHRSRPEREPSFLAGTTTDRSGQFVVSDLPPGTYTLMASSGMFAPAERILVETGAKEWTVRLREGVTIEGQVTDEATGDPIAGATVTPWADEVSLDLVKKTATDDEGLFRIAGLALLEREVVILNVTHPEHGSEDFRRTVDPAAQFLELELAGSRALEGRVVDAAGHAVAGARVALRAAVPDLRDSLRAELSYTRDDGSFRLSWPSVLPYWGVEVVATHGDLIGLSETFREETPPSVEIALRPASALTGRVVDASGNPVASAAVRARRLTRRNEMTSLFHCYDAPRSAYTRAGGNFALKPLEPGIYKVNVSAFGYAFLVVEEVEVGDEPAVRDFVLEAGVPVEGRVVDSRGEAVEDAEVMVLESWRPEMFRSQHEVAMIRTQRRWNPRALVSTRTDASGRYRLANLPERELALVAYKDGAEPSQLLTLEPGSEPRDLVLVPYAALAGAASNAQTGEPIRRFRLELFRKSEDTPETTMSFAVDDIYDPRDVHHPDGRFYLWGLHAGTHHFRVRATGFEYFQRQVEVGAGEVTTIELKLQPADPRRTVRGRISDAETGLPVANVRVAIYVNSLRDFFFHDAIESRSNEDGTFALEGTLTGNYTYHTSHPDYAVRRGKTEIFDDRAPFLSIELQPAAQLSGVLRNHARAADVVVERVVLRSTDDKDERHFCNLREDGTFSAKNLPPGTYEAYLIEELRRDEQTDSTGDTERSTRERRLGEVLILARETTVFEVDAP